MPDRPLKAIVTTVRREHGTGKIRPGETGYVRLAEDWIGRRVLIRLLGENEVLESGPEGPEDNL